MSRSFATNQYLAYNAADMFSGMVEPLCLVGWFKTPGTAGTWPFGLVRTSSGTVGWRWELFGFNQRLFAKSENLSGQNGSSGTASSSFSTDTWVLGIARFVSSTSRFGRVNSTTATEDTTSVSQSGLAIAYIEIGNNWAGDEDGIKLAELAVVGRDLTSDEMTALATKTPNSVITGSDLKAYWSFNSSSLVDSVNGWTLTEAGSGGNSSYDADHPSLSSTRKIILART